MKGLSPGDKVQAKLDRECCTFEDKTTAEDVTKCYWYCTCITDIASRQISVPCNYVLPLSHMNNSTQIARRITP